MILAGDIGGTKTDLALFDDQQNMVEGKTFPSREYGRLEEIVGEFISETGARPSRSCFGIAGPVRHGRSKTTNLPWVVDARLLAKTLGLGWVSLINDLEASAHGISALKEEDFEVLSQGAPDAEGNAALISAGTGLGEAGLFWDGTCYHPFASEGGHCSFSPRNELEIELWKFLRHRFSVVSWERVLSGPGLKTLYDFLREREGKPEPEWLARELVDEDPSAAISHAALSGMDPVARAALNLFVSLYGAEAGNAALKFLATGGVFLGGGVAPKILPKLKDSGFKEGFLEKGRMKALLERIPVRVILNPRTPLMGAARFAAGNPAPGPVPPDGR